MKTVSVKIKNFRGYREEVEIKFDDLTVFVGKNDVGKLTILEALDIFFNDGKGVVKIEKNDVNVEEIQKGNLETVISVCFKELPNEIVIDSTVKTNLKEEYLLNSDGYLEIVKKYNNGGSAKVCDNLLLAKNSDLKKIVKQEDIECENQTINAELRKAIWNNYIDELQLNDKEIDISKEDAKKIWDKIACYMPVYSLFQSDKKNSDGDDNIPINKRGSGLKRLVLLNFFIAEAERISQLDKKTGIIYAIEEPETSQHTKNIKLNENIFKTKLEFTFKLKFYEITLA